ncbi:MAG: hypothetical protein KF729_09080 [Sandaracinaceae bacterium]|nr:hypothetical protein [Sandaracinaceae bacterium]
MLLVAQRVRGVLEGINVSAYVHPPQASAILARDPSLAFDHGVMAGLGAAPSLALTLRAVKEPSAIVLSFLDLAFPDPVPPATVAGLLEQAVLRGPAGNHDATWVNGVLGLRFRADALLDPVGELGTLKSALLPVLGHGVTRLRNEPPIAVRPSQPVKIYLDRAAHGTRYTLDPSDRETLMTLVGGLPMSLAIADETRLDFLDFALAPLEQIVIEALTGVSVAQISAYGGAIIIDRATGRVLWPSPDAA